MHWVVQTNLYDEEGLRKLVETLDRLGLPWSEHTFVPFSGEIVPEPDIKEKHVFVVGAYSAWQAARRHDWFPGVIDIGHVAYP